MQQSSATPKYEICGGGCRRLLHALDLMHVYIDIMAGAKSWEHATIFCTTPKKQDMWRGLQKIVAWLRFDVFVDIAAGAKTVRSMLLQLPMRCREGVAEDCCMLPTLP